MRGRVFRKVLVFSIVVCFVGAGVVPTLNGNSDGIMVLSESSDVVMSKLRLYPIADTSIHQRSPDNNYGTSTSLLVSNRYGATDDYEADALIRFDLSSIPPSATINSAFLNLYYYRYDDTDPAGLDISCYRITSDWDEYTCTWNNRPSYASTVTSYATIPEDFGWVNWDVTSDVQDFVDGTKTNYGWWIMDENYWGRVNIPQQYYKSRESSIKPYLEIEFETPPNPPSDPVPPNQSTDVGIHIVMYWSCSDPDGDPVRYDVYFGTNSSPPLVAPGWLCPWYDPPGVLEYDTKYYWKIVASDNHGHRTAGPIWNFVTKHPPNLPPYKPSNPDPTNGAVNVPINVGIHWTGGDPNPGDLVTYDVYFGNSIPPPKVASNQTSTVYVPGMLEYNTTYHWMIVAWDHHGLSTAGPVWYFTTIEKQSILEIESIHGGPGVVQAVIKNRGGINAINLSWSIKLAGGLILKGKESSGVMPLLQPGAGVTITSNETILGIGLPEVEITANASGFISASENKRAVVLIFYVKILPYF